MTLHEFLDLNYGAEGDEVLRKRLAVGEDLETRFGANQETPLHVATRRRRLSAVEILLEAGADINAESAPGKTAYAHAIRRSFSEVAELLANRGANTELNIADRFAVAIVDGDLEKAKSILAENPGVARTGNPEEDRLLADVAGRNEVEPVEFLILAGADLTATALDSGTALHQAAWFGQPANAKLLIEAGAPLDHFEETHGYSPLGWAVHGARYSGGAEERKDVYIELVKMLLAAGSSFENPKGSEPGQYKISMLKDAPLWIEPLLKNAFSA